MTDWYDNRVSLHDKREGWLRGLVLAYGIVGRGRGRRSFRIASHSTCPSTLVYRTPAVLNHHDGCNVRSVRESGTVIVDRSAGGCRKLPKCRQTLMSYQRCRHVLKAFEPDDSESTRPGIASERSESQLPINPS
ncbi:hypothetical protein B0T13DRAFT_489957 [Neurospora crassa]|nr:hypothetical protein B0T13DRAFT_489957 [Neurospora crassa]